MVIIVSLAIYVCPVSGTGEYDYNVEGENYSLCTFAVEGGQNTEYKMLQNL